MRTFTFKYGGVHPPDKKSLAAEIPSERLPLPEKLSVSMWQHLGKPAVPEVNKGDIVEEGQRIGDAAGFVSAHIHAPAAGTVKNIADAPPPLGRNALSVEIAVDASAERKEYARDDNALHTSNEEILSRIRNAGIVGLGGAMFPTHVKLQPPPDKPIDTLIVNAVECEPYITADYRMMLEKPSEIIEGIRIVRKLLSPKKIYIGIEANKPKAIEIIERAIKTEPDMEVIVLKTQYPQGGEKQLIQAATGREVPVGGLPSDVGTLVQNAATLYAIYEAVYYKKPLTERIVTVSGEAIRNPKNLWVKFGTPIEAIIERCGGATEENVLAIAGGPMMGVALPSLNQTTVKGTNAIILLPDKGRKKYEKEYQCIRCNRCVEVCPIKLIPRDIVQRARIDDRERMADLDIMSCIECGACSYACPAMIPLVQWIRVGKTRLRAEGAKA